MLSLIHLAPDRAFWPHSRVHRAARLADFFALKRNIVILLLTLLVIGAGEELWLRFVPKYLQSLGAGALVIGLYDALRTLLGALYAYPGGVMVDRWGHRRAFLTFNIVSIAGYALALIPHAGAVMVGMFLFLAWSCFSLPAVLSLVGASLHASRYSMAIGLQMIVKRVPIMIAPIFGGIMIDQLGVTRGVRLGLCMSILLSGLAILVQRRLDPEPTEKAPTAERWNFLRTLRQFNTPLRQLLLSDILVRFCERIPFAWVVIFAMDYIGATGRQVGLLISLEVVIAALCIIPTSYFADKHGREPFVIATFVMFTFFPLTLLFSRSLAALSFAFIVRGLKEFGDTPRKALILAGSDANRRGQMVGAYYLTRDVIASLGAIVGAYLWKLGPEKNFLGAAAFGVAGTVIYIRSVRHEREAELAQLKSDLFKRRSSEKKL